jgi:hypothetical protein
MAPEIKNGNYTASIDVYACGIILFEMVCGHRPFEGETPMEVMMKHYIDAPKLDALPAAYRGVIGRALEKDPARRYGSVAELARAVEEMFGAKPAPLPLPPEPAPVPAPRTPPRAAPAARSAVLPVAVPVAVPRAARNKYAPPAPPPAPQTSRDRLTDLAGGLALAPLVAAACTAPWAVFRSDVPWTLLGRVFLLSTALAWALMLIGRFGKRRPDNPWVRRGVQVAAGVLVGALAFWLDGWALPTGTANASSRDLVVLQHRITPAAFSIGLQYLLYFGLSVGIPRWWKATDRKRRERVRFVPLIATAFWGTVFLFLWPGESKPIMLGVSVLVIAAVAAQVASPWAGPPQPYPARGRGYG